MARSHSTRATPKKKFLRQRRKTFNPVRKNTRLSKYRSYRKVKTSKRSHRYSKSKKSFQRKPLKARPAHFRSEMKNQNRTFLNRVYKRQTIVCQEVISRGVPLYEVLGSTKNAAASTGILKNGFVCLQFPLMNLTRGIVRAYSSLNPSKGIDKIIGTLIDDDSNNHYPDSLGIKVSKMRFRVKKELSRMFGIQHMVLMVSDAKDPALVTEKLNTRGFMATVAEFGEKYVVDRHSLDYYPYVNTYVKASKGNVFTPSIGDVKVPVFKHNNPTLFCFMSLSTTPLVQVWDSLMLSFDPVDVNMEISFSVPETITL